MRVYHLSIFLRFSQLNIGRTSRLGRGRVMKGRILPFDTNIAQSLAASPILQLVKFSLDLQSLILVCSNGLLSDLQPVFTSLPFLSKRLRAKRANRNQPLTWSPVACTSTTFDPLV